MQKNEPRYILHIFGENEKGNVLEKRYFPRLGDAFVSLLQLDILQFDKDLASINEKEDYYAVAKITDGEPANEYVTLSPISISDSAKGSPTAGIYLHFPYDLEIFEQQIGTKLSNFSPYDPGAPFLRLSKYSYIDELFLTDDPALESLRQELGATRGRAEAQGVGMYYYELRVCVMSISEEQDISADDIVLTASRFFHLHFNDAFCEMMQLDMRMLDPDLARDHDLEGHIVKAAIYSPDGRQLMHLSTVRQEPPASDSEDEGAYLWCTADIHTLEKLGEVDLSILGRYDNDAMNFRILRYSADHTDLIPLPGFHALVESFYGTESAQVLEHYSQNDPYRLEIEWIALSNPPAQMLIEDHLLQSRTFGSIVTAIEALHSLERGLFDPETARMTGAYRYIRVASVFDTTDNRPMLSKFLVSDGNSNIPNGLYLKFDEAKTTVEMLSVVLQQVPGMRQQSNLSFLVGDTQQAATTKPEKPEQIPAIRQRRDGRHL